MKVPQAEVVNFRKVHYNDRVEKGVEEALGQMNFKLITLEDKEWMDCRLKASGFQGCDYSFANLYLWRNISQVEVADYAGMLCIRSKRLSRDQYIYTFPAGNGDLKQAVEAMREDCAKNSNPFVLRGFSDDERQRLEEELPGRFTFESIRKEWDYLYLVEDLANLAGKKYHGKRNHIARFMDLGEWKLEPITAENKEACIQMCSRWYEMQKESGKESSLLDRQVVESAFAYYEVLKLQGAALYLNGEIVGITMGEPLNKDTFAVHIEKAFADIQGAYPMLNKQFVTEYMSGYTYVNREEDDGGLGLRKAKESYYPVKMLEKYHAYEKGERT